MPPAMHRFPGDIIDFPPGRPVLVVGDVMLDRSLEGTVGRVSPEAPVPVLSVARTVERAGGAANVCTAATAAGGAVTLVGCVGDDPPGRSVRRLLGEQGVSCEHLLDLVDHPTTVKTRLLAGHQQIARYDVERIGIPQSAAGRLRAAAGAAGVRAAAIILSDYAKGVCDPDTCAAVVAAGTRRGIPVIVDPKSADFTRYAGATVITPNRSEAAAAAGRPIDGIEAAVAAGRTIVQRYGIEAAVVTLGEQGLVAVSACGQTVLPARSREVFDVTGAGDTVVAVLAVALAGGVDLFTACALANTAAGIKVGRPGTATVTRDEILQGLRPTRPGGWRDKIVTSETLVADLAMHRRLGRTIGFTNGCFDILHHGHVAILEAAARECDLLVVGLNADASVRRLKGPSRPIVPEAQRAAVLAALASVAYVVLFSEDTPARLIEAVAPDVLVKGGDYAAEGIVGAESVVARGGRVVSGVFVEGASTTDLVGRIRAPTTDARRAA
jgi:D-beta-D-heptose 7-phosphate kinase/D-beta-D-heptose 1-phosphate adenosyltransferase